jgi:hypothetical protein
MAGLYLGQCPFTEAVAQEDPPAAPETAGVAKPHAKPKPKPKPQPPHVVHSSPVQPAAATAETAAPQQAPAGQSPFAALEQAKKLGVRACLPVYNDLLSRTINSEHVAVTNWNKETPDLSTIFSMNLLKIAGANNPAPRAIGFVSATPTAGARCDGELVRVQPSSLSCDEIAGNLTKANKPAPQITNEIRIYAPDATGLSLILLPGVASGCVVIGSGVYYGK